MALLIRVSVSRCRWPVFLSGVEALRVHSSNLTDEERHQGAKKLSDLTLHTQRTENGATFHTPSSLLAFTPRTFIAHGSRHQKCLGCWKDVLYTWFLAHMLMEENGLLRTHHPCFICAFAL